MKGASRLVWPLLAVVAVEARAQSLLEGSDGQPQTTTTQPGLVAASGSESVAERLSQVSLFAVVPPKPKTYQVHDLVEVIVKESSVQKFKQSLDTKEKLDLTAELTKFPSLRNLLEAQLRQGDSTGLPVGVGIKNDDKYKGEGTYERKDDLTSRLMAEVIDVKPNGTLVIEAREVIDSDGEKSTMVLSGICRNEDITKQNTLQSTQLARLNIRVEHEGEVKNASEKGLLTKVFEAIFNF